MFSFGASLKKKFENSKRCGAGIFYTLDNVKRKLIFKQSTIYFVSLHFFSTYLWQLCDLVGCKTSENFSYIVATILIFVWLLN